MKKIAALLTVHNRKEKTLACLGDLFKQHLPEGVVLEVFLTDDGCTDGTRESVKEKFPQVVIVNGDGSLFWNRGMVAAWKEAAKSDYDFYLWLNDDTFIYCDAIGRLLNSSVSHQDKAIIVGTTSTVGKNEDVTYGGRDVNGNLITDVDEEKQCKTFNGNIVLIPKHVYKKLGTNDPHYRHALGDHDYGLMATQNRIEIWTASGILGECDRHDIPTVWMDPSQPFLKRWKNLFSPLGNNPFEFFYYRKKHYGLAAACMTFASNFLHFLFPKFWKGSY